MEPGRSRQSRAPGRSKQSMGTPGQGTKAKLTELETPKATRRSRGPPRRSRRSQRQNNAAEHLQDGADGAEDHHGGAENLQGGADEAKYHWGSGGNGAAEAWTAFISMTELSGCAVVDAAASRKVHVAQTNLFCDHYRNYLGQWDNLRDHQTRKSWTWDHQT